jgi:hypothetical protein
MPSSNSLIHYTQFKDVNDSGEDQMLLGGVDQCKKEIISLRDPKIKIQILFSCFRMMLCIIPKIGRLYDIMGNMILRQIQS